MVYATVKFDMLLPILGGGRDWQNKVFLLKSPLITLIIEFVTIFVLMYSNFFTML